MFPVGRKKRYFFQFLFLFGFGTVVRIKSSAILTRQLDFRGLNFRSGNKRVQSKIKSNQEHCSDLKWKRMGQAEYKAESVWFWNERRNMREQCDRKGWRGVLIDWEMWLWTGEGQ